MALVASSFGPKLKTNRLEMFGDWQSYGHVLLGWMAARNPLYMLAAVALFIAYQFAEDGTRAEQAGDLAEFGLGLAIGAVMGRGE